METVFRTFFWLIFLGMLLLQAYFSLQVRRTGGKHTADRIASGLEGRWFAAVRAGRMLFLLAFLVLYAADSPLAGAVQVPFPDGLRGLGVVSGIAGLGLYAWARAILGREWSSRLRIRKKHKLVTAGPYARIRHPVYSALILFMTGITLIAANGLMILFLIVSVLDLVFRMPREERMMIEEFGGEYSAYMRTTGRIFPKWNA